MPKRRKVLLGLGASIALAGCSGEEGTTTQEPTNTPTEEATETPQPAQFTVGDIQPKNELVTSEEIEPSATITNEGELAATKEAEMLFQDEVVFSEEISLEPEEETTIKTTISNYNLDYNRYTFKIRTEDSTHDWIFRTYTHPVEQPDSVPEYTIEEKKDVSYEDVTRWNYEITSNPTDRWLTDLSSEDLLNICRSIILDTMPNMELNSISFNFWRGDQEIGSERAQAVIDWAPNGNWSEAGNVESGNYSNHQFSVSGIEYIEVKEINGPDEVEPNEEFTIQWILENNGFSDVDISGWIENLDDMTLKEFEIHIDVGQTEDVTLTDELIGWDLQEQYSLHRSLGTIHSITYKSVDVQ